MINVDVTLCPNYRYARYDDAFNHCKSLELNKKVIPSQDKFVHGDSLLDWLDKLTLLQLQASCAMEDNFVDSANNNELLNRNAFAEECVSTEKQDLQSYAFLVIDLPLFPHTVLFDEKCTPAPSPHIPRTSLAMLAVRDGPRSDFENDNGHTIYEFNLTGRNFSGQALQQVVDWEMELAADNPCEDMHRRLAHDSTRGLGGRDQAIKPNLQEKDKLDRILTTPGDHLRTEDKDLLFRFR